MTNTIEVRVPDIGDFDGVDVIEVLVAVGDSVAAEDSLLTLESDKATMEIPSPQAGVVSELKINIGDTVSEGDLVLLLDASSEPATTAPASPGPAGTEPPADVVEQAEITDVSPTPEPKSAPTVAAPAAPGPRTPPVPYDASKIVPDKKAHASPAVRKFARELGVHIGEVSGSGRNGRVTQDDVQQFIKGVLQSKGAGSPTATSGTGLALLDWPKVDFAKFGPVESKPLSRIQKISGANLARNWVMIPHVTQHDEADITDMEAFRKAHSEQAKAEGYKLTPLAFLIKAVVAALKKYPNFNASLDGDNLILKQYFNVGVAVDTPDGLVVPVIRDCDQKSLSELGREIVAASVKARDKKLMPADLQGGCFSISSLGGIGGTAFTPIVNAPEVAILGVSRSAIKPTWNGAEFAPRLMLPLSLSYDHRVIDGASAARFTSYLGYVLSDLKRLLL